jgi:membrane protein YqaA with SNARE-associated domain
MSQSSKLQFYVLLSLLLIVQVLINSMTNWSIDIFGSIIIVLALTDDALLVITLIAAIADLLGHWYLGTHLLSILVIGAVFEYIRQFFVICSFMQRLSLVTLCFISFSIVECIIDVVSHGMRINLYSYIINIFVICPLVFLLLGNNLYNRLITHV